MNDDELKNLWQQQPLRVPDISATQLISVMQKKMSEFRRTIFWRDVRELAACAVLLIIFGYDYFHRVAMIAQIGDLIIVGGSIFIAWKLVHAQRSNPPAPPGATVAESLRAELNSVRTQSRLLGSVLWWYLLPLTIGELVFMWGLSINTNDNSVPWWVIIPTNIFSTLVVLAVNAGVYWLNKWARAKQLLPAEAQLQSLLHSTETGEPLDDTQVSSLRTIALSMDASSQVKPVEFKVAFWQIALYGVIGFIGIWLVLMLGLAADDAGSKTNEQAPKPVAQAIGGAETNRYSVAARKVIDLFNAGNYTGVQKLYNPEMGEAFPLPKTVGFYAGIATEYGKIETFEGPTGGGYHGWTAFQLHYQHGELLMSIALDDDDQISGIYFKPPPMNIERFARGIFGRNRLLWIVPFFVAGLLFSRLLQKATERAVGISILGIHLRKGQNLLLWDEIKEVQPLKILNIRSLWLINEFGEKTIMPFTSLERHSELKAAIERFAPANHPMRECVSLLKRI